jgi:hypothetical protein
MCPMLKNGMKGPKGAAHKEIRTYYTKKKLPTAHDCWRMLLPISSTMQGNNRVTS